MQLTGKSWQALRYFLASKWQALLYLGGLSVLVALFESLATLAIYPILVLVTPPAVGEASHGFLQGIISWIYQNRVFTPMYTAAFLLFMLTLIKVVLSYSQVLFAWITSNKIFQETQIKMITLILFADYQFLVNTQKGDLVYRLLNAPGYISKVINTIPVIGVEVLKISMIIAMLLVLSPKVTFILLVVAALFFWVTRLLAQRVSYATGSGRARSASNQAIHAMNALKGFKSIRLYGVTNYWIELFAEECRAFYKYALKDSVIGEIPKNLLELVSISLICIMVWYFGATPEGIMSNIPVLGVFAFSLLKIMPSLKLISSNWLGLFAMLPHAEAAYLAIIDADHYRNTLEGADELKAFGSRIELKNIVFNYANTKESVLKGINLSIEAGRFIGIIGYSGSGKTTLLDLVANLLRPSSGEVLIDGRPISLYSSESISKHMGYVGQETFLFNDTIRQNILFGREGYDDSAVKEALKKSGLLDFVETLPGGLDFVLADDGLKISGGQRQRISIARAMLRNPEILLLDEATSALDQKTEVKIMETILELVRRDGKTVIFVTHRKSALDNADYVIEMKDGKLFERARV